MANYYWNQIRKQNINNNAFSNIVPGSGNGGGGSGSGGKCWQVKTMPEASEANDGMIVEYIGENTQDYGNGYAYQCSKVPTYTLKVGVTAYDGTGSVAAFQDVIFNIDTFENELHTTVVIPGDIYVNVTNAGSYYKYDVTVSGVILYYSHTQTLDPQEVWDDLIRIGITPVWDTGYGPSDFNKFAIAYEYEQSGHTYTWLQKPVQDLIILAEKVDLPKIDWQSNELVLEIPYEDYDLRSTDYLVTIELDRRNSDNMAVKSFDEGHICISNVDAGDTQFKISLKCDQQPSVDIAAVLVFRRTAWDS